MRGKAWFSCLLILGLSLPSWAQDSTYALTFGGGGALYSVQDLFASPRSQTGLMGYSSIGYVDPMSELEFHAHYGQLTNGSAAFDETVTAFRGDVNYRQYLNFNFLPNEQMNLGFGVLSHGVVRQYPTFDNNSIQYDVSTGLSLEFRYLKPLALDIGDRQLAFRWHASLPVAFLVIRPGFNTSIPSGYLSDEVEGIGGLFRSAEAASLNQARRFISKASLRLPFLNGNALEVHYLWDFYQYRMRNLVTAGTHQVGLTLYLNTHKP